MTIRIIRDPLALWPSRYVVCTQDQPGGDLHAYTFTLWGAYRLARRWSRARRVVAEIEVTR